MINTLRFVKKIPNTLDCPLGDLGLIDPYLFMKNKLKEYSWLEWYKIIVNQIIHFFKRNVYKHMSLIFGKKFKYTLKRTANFRFVLSTNELLWI